MPKITESGRRKCLVCGESKLTSDYPNSPDGAYLVCSLCVETNREEWREVPDWPEYQASNLGRVRFLGGYRPMPNGGHRYVKPREVTPKLSPKQSNYTITLYSHARKPTYAGVANLVLRTFVRLPREGEVARHYLDPTLTNCHLENLRWGTESENRRDEARHNDGIQLCTSWLNTPEIIAKRARTRRGKPAKLTHEQISLVKKLLVHTAMSQAAIASEVGVSQWTVCYILHHPEYGD